QAHRAQAVRPRARDRHARGPRLDVARVRALALNAGSSSLKAALFEVEPGAALAVPADPVWRGQVDWDPADGAATAQALLCELPAVDVVGHRIVHGGERFGAPTAITPAVEAAVRSLSASAPLHNGAALEGVAAAEARFG